MIGQITILFGVAAITGLLGIILGRWSMLDSIRYYQAETKLARRFAGKLSTRIGKQRVKINELKKKLKAVATSTPAMAKPSTRPNLPH